MLSEIIKGHPMLSEIIKGHPMVRLGVIAYDIIYRYMNLT